MPRSPRSLWLLALLAALASGVYFAAARLGLAPQLFAPRCERCNVVLVTFDALRAGHLGIHGYARDVSPEIDAFGRRSSVFTRCISQSGSTVSSIPSIHTAKYPNTDRLLEGITLRENEPTLAEIGKTVLKIDSDHYGRVEDAHMFICHLLAYAFMENVPGT